MTPIAAAGPARRRTSGGSPATQYLGEFQALAINAAGQEPGWLLAQRTRAIETFSRLGFPTSGEEDWRFTDVAPIARAVFRPPGDAVQPRRGHLDWHWLNDPRVSELVFLNGRLAPDYSSLIGLPPKVKLGSLRRALAVDGAPLERYLGRLAPADRQAFVALNTALFQDGACLYVPPGVVLPGPIHLLFLVDANGLGAAVQPRTLLILDRGAHAAVIETYVSMVDGAYLTNTVTELVLGEGAFAEYTKVQVESEAAYHIGSTYVEQAQDSHLTSYSVTFGGAIGRNGLDVVMDGTGVECTLAGLYMGRGRQLLDNHTSIVHAHAHGSSRELYKGVLDGHAHAVFNGKVIVTPEAQKTDGKQTNRNLLLSDHAKADTKPQLEIFADDVKCTHGATVGRLDEQALFYLKSRGLGANLARRILTYAFAAEVLEEIPYPGLRARLEKLVMNRLDGGERSPRG